MKKHGKNSKRLQLRKQALRRLDLSQMTEVNGGFELKAEDLGRCTLSYTKTGY